ncbi:MAG: ATP-binding protein [Myxococcaceae bacterium]
MSPSGPRPKRPSENQLPFVDEVLDYGIFMLDSEGFIRTWNKGAERIKGYRADEIIGKHFSVFYSEEDRRAGRCEEEIAVATAVGRFEDEGWRLRKDGTKFWANVVLTAIRDEGGKVSGFVKVTRDLTARKQSEDSARRLAEERAARQEAQSAAVRAEEIAHRTQTLQDATSAFGEALTLDQVMQVIFRNVLPALGADSGSVALLAPGSTEFELVWTHGHNAERIKWLSRFPLNASLPHSDAGRNKTALFFESNELLSRSYPHLSASSTLSALASLPLLVAGRCVGVLAATYSQPKVFSVELRTLAVALANQCAQALERARAFQEEKLARARIKLLADASKLLSQSLDYEQTMATLTQLMVPERADWCAVDIVTNEGEVRRLAVAHPDRERAALAFDYQRRYPVKLMEGDGIGQVILTGQSVLMSEVPLSSLDAIADPTRRAYVRKLGIHSFVCVPLTSRNKVLGALTLAYADSERRYGDADLALAEDLANRAASALDNALLYREAQAAVQARDSFLSVASHELNTPLTSIKLNFESLGRALSQLAPEHLAPLKADTKLQAVERQLSRLTGLVRDLLDVSRITTGVMKLEPAPVEFISLVREVVARSTDDALRAGSIVHLDAQGTATGMWDRLRLDQVVTNLLSNAIKYGHGKPVSVSVRQTKDEVLLIIRDQGIGIAEVDRQRLFQRFERVADARHYSGWGLGLWIVKQVLDAMGGTVEVESSPGKGSAFTVHLPLHDADHAGRSILPSA